MNIVHEQCPKSASETVLSPKTGSKLSQVHRAPNLAQPVHTSAPRRSQVRTGAPRCAQARPSVSCRRLLRSCRGRGPRRVTGAGLLVMGAGAVSQGAVSRAWLPCPGLAVLYCDTAQPYSLSPCHNTPRCIAIQMPSLSSSRSHNTISVLRYNSFNSQAPLSQYTVVYCDTNLNHPATH